MRIGLAALTALALAAVAPPAAAQTALPFDNYCVTGSFTVCASVRTTISADGRTITMQIWNLEGSTGFPQAAQSSLSSFGLYHIGSDFDWSGKFTATVEHVDEFGVHTNISTYFTSKGNNIQAEVYQNGKGNNGVNGCTETGDGGTHWRTCDTFPESPYVLITFNLTQAFSTENVALRWHAQQLPDGGSIKCDTAEPNCIPTTTVPEPVTLALVGSGLVGVGGARFLRRRREPDADTEA